MTGLWLIASGLVVKVISPPVIEKVFPCCTKSRLPWNTIPDGLLSKNPKATGEATVNVLLSVRFAEKVAPSWKRIRLAVLT
jgi:hypothetical protein